MPTSTKTGAGLSAFTADGYIGAALPTDGFSYQWQRGDVAATNWVNVPSAEDIEYVPADADIGSRLRCRVTRTNSAGSTTVYSTPSQIISATGDEGNARTEWNVLYAVGDTREWDSVQDSIGFADTDAVAYGSLLVVSALDGMPFPAEIQLPASGTSGQERLAQGVMGRTATVGATDYYRLQVYFPSPWTDASAEGVAILQPNAQDLAASPPIQVRARDTYVEVAIRSGLVTWDTSGDPVYTYDSGTGGHPQAIPTADFTTDAWHDLVVGIKWATDTTGVLETWWRPSGTSAWTQTINLSGVPTFQYGTHVLGYNWESDGTDGAGADRQTYDKAGGDALYGTSSVTFYHATLGRHDSFAAATGEETGTGSSDFTGGGPDETTWSKTGSGVSTFTGHGLKARTDVNTGRGISDRTGHGADALTDVNTGRGTIDNMTGGGTHA